MTSTCCQMLHFSYDHIFLDTPDGSKSSFCHKSREDESYKFAIVKKQWLHFTRRAGEEACEENTGLFVEKNAGRLPLLTGDLMTCYVLI